MQARFKWTALDDITTTHIDTLYHGPGAATTMQTGILTFRLNVAAADEGKMLLLDQCGDIINDGSRTSWMVLKKSLKPGVYDFFLHWVMRMKDGGDHVHYVSLALIDNMADTTPTYVTYTGPGNNENKLKLLALAGSPAASY